MSERAYWRDCEMRANTLRCCAVELENNLRGGHPVNPLELIAWYRAQADNLDPNGRRNCLIHGCDYVTAENTKCVHCGEARPTTKPLMGRSPIGARK